MGNNYIKETSYCITCGAPVHMHELQCSRCRKNGVKPKHVKSDNEHLISLDNEVARAMHISYGQKVALYGHVKPTVEYVPRRKK